MHKQWPRFVTWLGMALVVAAPAAVSLLLVHSVLGAAIGNFVPATDDEMFYWREIDTFSAVNFRGGYYTYEEQPAAWTVSHFGAHGPLFPMLYGGLGELFGWHPNTVVFFNLLVVTAALAVLVVSIRPTLGQLGLFVVLLATFWPLQWELPSLGQEALHLGFAILMAAVFFRLLRSPGRRPQWVTTAVVLSLLLASLFRPFWIALLLPYLILNYHPGSARAWLAVLAASAAAVVGVFVTTVYISAPYPSFVRNLMVATAASRRVGLRLLASYALENTKQFLDWRGPLTFFNVNRYQLVLLLLALVLVIGLALWQSRRAGQPWRAYLSQQSDQIFHLYNAGLITLVVLALYIPTGYEGFRVFAPYLLMTSVLLILSRRWVLVALVLVSGLLQAPAFVHDYAIEKGRNFAYDPGQVSAFSASVGNLLDYDPHGSAWSNTLLLDGQLLCYQVRCDYLMAVPAGRGVSVIFFPDRLTAPLKSKYLLLSQAGYTLVQNRLGSKLHLQLLRTTPVGGLYLNLDCACP